MSENMNQGQTQQAAPCQSNFGKGLLAGVAGVAVVAATVAAGVFGFIKYGGKVDITLPTFPSKDS